MRFHLHGLVLHRIVFLKTHIENSVQGVLHAPIFYDDCACTFHKNHLSDMPCAHNAAFVATASPATYQRGQHHRHKIALRIGCLV